MSKYSDFKTNLDVHPTRGDLVLLEDSDAVKRSIRNLLTTRAGERFYDDVTLGGGLDDLLFENITAEFETLVADQIKRTIANYEPRAVLKGVEVKADEDHNAYNATITFATVNRPVAVSLSLILTRIR